MPKRPNPFLNPLAQVEDFKRIAKGYAVEKYLKKRSDLLCVHDNYYLKCEVCENKKKGLVGL